VREVLERLWKSQLVRTFENLLRSVILLAIPSRKVKPLQVSVLNPVFSSAVLSREITNNLVRFFEGKVVPGQFHEDKGEYWHQAIRAVVVVEVLDEGGEVDGVEVRITSSHEGD